MDIELLYALDIERLMLYQQQMNNFPYTSNIALVSLYMLWTSVAQNMIFVVDRKGTERRNKKATLKHPENVTCMVVVVSTSHSL